jgi:tetratricopeptide (TPR) repeat protein
VDSEWELETRLEARPFSPKIERILLQQAFLRLFRAACGNSVEATVQAIESWLIASPGQALIETALSHFRTHAGGGSTRVSEEIAQAVRLLVGGSALEGSDSVWSTGRSNNLPTRGDHECASVDARLVNLPKAIPSVDLTCQQTDDDGDLVLDVSHLTMGSSEVRLPLIVDYKTCGSISTTRHDATIITDCSSVGGVLYAHVMYVFEKSSSFPLMIIAAEGNALQKMLPGSKSGTQPLFLGLFRSSGRINLGLFPEIHEIDDFVSKAREVVTKVTSDVEFREAEAQDVSARIQEVLREGWRLVQDGSFERAFDIFDATVGSLRPSSCRIALTDALLGTAVCHLEQGANEVAAGILEEALAVLAGFEGHPDDVAAISLELTRAQYLSGTRSNAIAACHRAIGLKLSQHARTQRSGLAMHTELINFDLVGELLLLGNIHANERNSQVALELLQMGLVAARTNGDSVLEGWALESLAVVSAELNNWSDAAAYFADCVRIKLETNDVERLWAMVATMTVAWSSLGAEQVGVSRDILDRMRWTL